MRSSSYKRTISWVKASGYRPYPNGGKKEGVVICPMEPVLCPLINASLSIKIVSNKYLMKNEG